MALPSCNSGNPESHSAETEKKKYAASRGEIAVPVIPQPGQRIVQPVAQICGCTTMRCRFFCWRKNAIGSEYDTGERPRRRTLPSDSVDNTPRRFQSHFRLFTAAKTAVTSKKNVPPAGGA